jgi:hypothetical protein
MQTGVPGSWVNLQASSYFRDVHGNERGNKAGRCSGAVVEQSASTSLLVIISGTFLRVMCR